MYVRTKGMTNERRPAEDLIFENISVIFGGPSFFFFSFFFRRLSNVARTDRTDRGGMKR